MTMPVPLIARKKFPYNGGSYVAGDAFEARDEADAHVLVEQLQLASRALADRKALEPEPVITPEPEPVESSEPPEVIEIELYADGPQFADVVVPYIEAEVESDSQPRKKRTYKRRDMQAEGE